MDRHRSASFVGIPPTLLLLTAGFAAGIWADRALDVPVLVSAALLLAAFLAWIALYRSGRNAGLAAACLLTAWFSAGAIRHHIAWNYFPANEVSRYATEIPQPVLIQVRALGEARQMALPEPTPLSSTGSEPRCRIPAAALALFDRGRWLPVSGNLTVFVRGECAGGQGGDRLQIAGELVRPEQSRNPGLFDFHERARSERNLVWLRVGSPDSVQLLESGLGWFDRARSRLRQRLDRAIRDHVGSGQAPVASAILLGNRNLVNPDEGRRFLETGTVHVLAISGLHVGIMAGGLFLALRIACCPRRVSLVLAMAAVLFYAWAVEFSTPVTRAAILIALYCLARLLAVHGRSLTLLAGSALVVLLVSPGNLFSVGAQLSFLAVAVLVWESRRPAGKQQIDPLQTLIRGTRPWPEKCLRWAFVKLCQSARVSGLIWLLTMPLVAARFHLFTPVAVLVNPLILVPMATALYGGMLVMLFGGWCPPVAIAGGWICAVSLELLTWLVDIFSGFPRGSCWVAGPGVPAVLVWFGGLTWLALRSPHLLRIRSCCLWTAVWYSFGWWLPAWIQWHRQLPPRNALDVTFVDVGHGNANIVRTACGKTLLYDAGSFGSSETGVRAVSACLWSAGVTRIDEVVISHADIDHFNAVPGICERFDVKRVWISHQMHRSSAASVEYLKNELVRLKTGLFILEPGDRRLQIGPEVRVTVHAPPPAADFGSDNANSLVLVLEHLPTGSSVLLTGDIEGQGLDELPAPAEPVTIAAAPHHGSLGSDPEKFCATVRPDLVAISADRNRLNPESPQRYRKNCRLVLSTSEGGAIRTRLTGDGVAHASWTGDCGRSLAHWNHPERWAVLPFSHPRPRGTRVD